MEAPHGTATRYRQGCHCEDCRHALMDHRHSIEDGDVNIMPRRKPGEEAPHGTSTRYRKGCRCETCMAGVAEYEHKRRLKQRVDAEKLADDIISGKKPPILEQEQLVWMLSKVRAKKKKQLLKLSGVTIRWGRMS